MLSKVFKSGPSLCPPDLTKSPLSSNANIRCGWKEKIRDACGHQDTNLMVFWIHVLTYHESWQDIKWHFPKTFKDMELNEGLLTRLAVILKSPYILQRRTIIAAMNLGYDLVCVATPNCGKTNSLMIAVAQNMKGDIKNCQSVILTSTIENAHKMKTDLSDLINFHSVQKVILIHNTCDNHENEEKLKETQVVVGTPSTIWKSVGKINFDHVKMLMLDEVNFIEGADLQKVTKLLKLLPRCTKTGLFTTKISQTVDDFVNRSMRTNNKINVIMDDSRTFYKFRTNH